MAVYRTDREWSDRIVRQIKNRIGPLLLTEATLEEDTQEATDLLVFKARDMRIAARVRRFGWFAEHGFEFTIRCRRDSGAKTELAKIVEGWGDWLFYCHTEESNVTITQWMVVDLHAFRAALIRENQNGVRIRSGTKANGDGTFFKWFDIRSFPEAPPILVGSSYHYLLDDEFMKDITTPPMSGDFGGSLLNGSGGDA